MNINIGGTKSWGKVDLKYRAHWEVMDIAGKPLIRYDINSNKPFPMSNDSVDNYYSSMTLEHINPQILPYFLKELYRTLKPKGKVRIVVPDIKIALRRYKQGEVSGGVYKPPYYPDTPLGLLMACFYTPAKGGRNGHCTVFDWETLVCVFAKAGFKQIERKIYQQGSEVFKGLDFERYEHHGIFMEAVK